MTYLQAFFVLAWYILRFNLIFENRHSRYAFYAVDEREEGAVSVTSRQPN